MDNPVKNVGKLPPKKLALVAVGGIGLGLLWRTYSKRKGGGNATTPASDDQVDTSQLALAGSSTGNLGALGGGGGTTTGVDDDDGTTRDVGTITLPVVKWVVTIGGRQFLTDGTNLEELGGGNVVTQVPPPSTVPPNKPSVYGDEVPGSVDQDSGWVFGANNVWNANTRKWEQTSGTGSQYVDVDDDV